MTSLDAQIDRIVADFTDAVLVIAVRLAMAKLRRGGA